MPEENDPVPTRKTPDYTERYSNGLTVELRLLDFRLRFGRCVHPEPCDNVPFMIEYFQGILLSPPEAKMFAAWLQSEVLRYEGLYGTIPTLPAAAPVAEKGDAVAADAPVPAVN